MNRTSIEYLDFTSNPIVGCDMTLPCAERCWARRMARRMRAQGKPQYQDVLDDHGNWTGKPAFNKTELSALLRRRKPAVVGLGFMGDAFHESVPDEWLDRMLAVVALTPHLRYILPTKRAKKMREYVTARRREIKIQEAVESRVGVGDDAEETLGRVLDRSWSWPLPNLALMVSASNQQELDERAGDFLSTPAALHILSLEPLLGVVDLPWEWLTPQCPECRTYVKRGWYDCSEPGCDGKPKGGLDWVILGGESGPGARPMVPEWPRAIRDQCVAAGITYFHKQNGEWSTVPTETVTIRTKYEDVLVGDGTHHRMFRVGRATACRLLDGKLWDQRPEMLK